MNTSAVTRNAYSLEVNKVLRNTYFLLALTLAFSAAMAGVSMMMNVGHINIFVWLIVTFGLLFAVHKTAESGLGLIMTFAFTGWMGFGLGPIVNAYTAAFGSGLIMQALGGTAAIFFALSAYVLTTKKDFSFMGGFLFAGMIVAMLLVIANIFIGSSGLHLALSGMIMLLCSGLILFDTSRIINGGERNYILATISIYMSLYNIFLSLLNLLAAFGSDE